MKRNIIKVGNSYGIVIPAVVLKLLKINPVTDNLEFVLENDKLLIKKAKTTSSQ